MYGIYCFLVFSVLLALVAGLQTAANSEEAFTLSPANIPSSNSTYHGSGDLNLLFAHYVHVSEGDVNRRSNRKILSDKVGCSRGYQSSCPPWFFCDENSSCTCGDTPNNIVMCNDELQTSAVLDCYCVTWDEESNSTVAGHCLLNCGNVDIEKDYHDEVYYQLPHNVTTINSKFCGKWNRAGPLCGRCAPNHYPLAYSYNMSCIPCPDGYKNLWKYLLVAFVPLTFFYLFVFFFKINATSSHLHAFVFYSQVISIPAQTRLVMISIQSSAIPGLTIGVKFIGMLYGIWNLDFFRTFVPGICLGTDILFTLALDYVIAIYPLLLMIVSYILIILYDRNVRCIVALWKPFRTIFTLFRRNWDIRTSVIDAYATFFLLSNVKFLSVCFDLLSPTYLYELQPDGNYTTTLRLYYAPDIEYFGHRHRPYAYLALAMLFLFVLLPVIILILYPFKLFHLFLNRFPFRFQILHTFVDSFQGCYKDGTEPGTQDCRWFSSLFLIFRFAMFVVYAFTLESLFFGIGNIIIITIVILLITAQPFKKNLSHYTRINATYLLLLALFSISILCINFASIKDNHLVKSFYVISFIFVICPLIYMSMNVIYWIISRRKFGLMFFKRVQACRQGYDWWVLDAFDSDQSLPDRLEHPENYHSPHSAISHQIM